MRRLVLKQSLHAQSLSGKLPYPHTFSRPYPCQLTRTGTHTLMHPIFVLSKSQLGSVLLSQCLSVSRALNPKSRRKVGKMVKWLQDERGAAKGRGEHASVD